jgi:4-azaleucine resistance transporter AzlC
MNSSISLPAPFRAAWLRAFPVVLGYLPIGFAFGILAAKAGISPANTMAMSLFVYAGSSQLIAVGLIAAGVSPWSIILTTFVVNLRHMLMSAALSPYMRWWRRPTLAFFAFELTDETFALHSVSFPEGDPDPSESVAVNAISQVAWVLGTWLGISAGNLISDVRPFGLDYALVAMFAALLVFQLKDRRTVAVALLAGVCSLLLLAGGVSQWNVILATVIAATAGVFIESWTKKSSS